MRTIVKYHIPQDILLQMLEKYRSGTSPVKLQAIYGYPYNIIVAKMRKYKFAITDAMCKNLQEIRKTEAELISGTFPDYKFEYKIAGIEDYDRYKRILNYYAKADLNNKFY